MIIILVLVLVFLVLLMTLYALWLRNWLKSKPWSAGFFAWIEPIERVLWKKSETILWARIKIVTGVLLAVLTQINGMDLTPVVSILPDAYAGYVRAALSFLPLLISIVGMADENLRNKTFLPVSVVALPPTVSPEVANAVEAAHSATFDAMAVVKDAKANPTAEVKVATPTEPPPPSG